MVVRGRLCRGRISQRSLRAESGVDANDRRRRAVGEHACADRQDAAIQRNDGRPVRCSSSNLRQRRHMGSELPPCHGERRGDRRMDGDDEPRAVSVPSERRRASHVSRSLRGRAAARPIPLCRTATFCSARGSSSYWRSRSGDKARLSARLRLHRARPESLLHPLGDLAQIGIARLAARASGIEVALEAVALRPMFAQELEAGVLDRLHGL